jgi:hypothetical protein
MENIEQYKNSLEMENAKSQSRMQLIQELIQSNLHLRSINILLENKIQLLNKSMETLRMIKNGK